MPASPSEVSARAGPCPRFTVRDDARDIEFQVYAYRPLSREEAWHAIAVHLLSCKRDPMPGSRVKVFTLIGAPADDASAPRIRIL
jgi:hypothetical protein